MDGDQVERPEATTREEAHSATGDVKGGTAISGRMVTFATITCFLAWAFSVYDYTLFGLLLPVIAEGFGWSTAVSTTVNTYVSLGMVVTAISMGPVIDYLGRRTSLVFTTVGAALSSGLTALAPNAVFMTIVRAFSGLGYAEQTVNAAYLSELYGKRPHRGFLYSLVQSGFPVGFLIGSALSRVLVPEIGWRGAFLVGLFPAVVIIILRLWLPESPTFEIVKRIRKLKTEGSHEEARGLEQQHGINMQQADRSTYSQIFAPRIRKHTIFLMLAFLLNNVGVLVFSFLGTTVLTEGKNTSFESALTVLIVSSAAGFLGYITHGYLGDLIGRRMTIFGGWLISGIVYTLMLLGPDSSGFVLSMYSIGLFFLLGPYAALLFFITESFPARMRGTGATLVSATGLLGLPVGSALFTVILNIGSTVVVAALFTGALATILSAFAILGTRQATVETAESS